MDTYVVTLWHRVKPGELGVCWHVRTVEPDTVWPYVDRLHAAVNMARDVVAADGKLRHECSHAALHLLSVESVHEFLRNQR